MDLGYIISRSPYTPYSICLRGTIISQASVAACGATRGFLGFLIQDSIVVGLSSRIPCQFAAKQEQMPCLNPTP